MTEFLSTYWIWILLGGIFVAMHLFGHGGHQHGSKRNDEANDEHAGHGAPASTKAGTTPARTTGGCH